VILNAYFGRGQFGGGFRIGWRALHGSDDNLDDNHLMRMAGRFSRRLRAWAKETQISVVYSSPGERKPDLAAQYLASNEVKPGLFMILVSKAPALVWEAQMTGTGKLGQLVIKEPWPYVNHYSFHISGPGLGTPDDQDEWTSAVRSAGDAERSRVCGLSGAKSWSRLHQTGQLLYQRHQRRGAGESRRYLVRTTDCRALTPALRALDLYHLSLLCSGFGGAEAECLSYQYSVYQMEYSRNLLFSSGRQMDEIFQALIDRTRRPLDLDRVRTIFGDKKRPHYDKRKKNPTRWGVVVETPAYDVTIFKVHYGKMTLKIYGSEAVTL
jgi:hypothetical protein